MSLEEFSSIFWASLRKIGTNSFLNHWWNSPVKPLVGMFLITRSISLLVISLFRFSISPQFSVGRLYISRNLSVYSRLSNLLAYNFS